MRKYILLLIFLLMTGSAALYAQSLVDVIPAPNYSYGLTHDGTNLWVASSYIDRIWEIDETGSVLDSLTAYNDETRGLAWDNSNLWGYHQIFGSSNKDRIIKYGAGGTFLDSLNSPYEDYIGGMCYGDGHLWVSVYYTGSGNPCWIYKIDPATGAVADSFETPGLQPQGLAFDGHSLWLAMDDNDGDPEKIWEIDPATGDTISSFDIPPYNSSTTASPKDLAYFNNHLYLVVGSVTNKAIYKFNIGGSGTPGVQLSHNFLAFPMTTTGDSSGLNIIVNSIGTADLVIDSLVFSDGHFRTDVSGLPATVSPGNSETFTVYFAPDDYYTYGGLLTVYTNDPLNPNETVQLSGQGLLPGVSNGLTALSHDFGTVWVQMDATVRYTLGLFNRGDQTLDITSLQFSLPEYMLEAPILPYNIASADTQWITIVFRPESAGTYDDTLVITNNESGEATLNFPVYGVGTIDNYSYGYQYWLFNIPDNPNGGTSMDYAVEGLTYINDLTGDGISEVIAATDNYWLLCLDGAGDLTTDIIWAFNSYITNFNAGSIGGTWDYGVQDALEIVSDLNGDGFQDIVAGYGGGNEHVYALDGTNGSIIWKYGDEQNYGMGDFQAVDGRRDFNGDNIVDVLAIADGNDTGTGHKSAFLFDGTNGNILWQYGLPGPNPTFGKSIISVDDVNGDGVPDAVIGVSNNGTTQLAAIGLNGTNGAQLWYTDMNDYGAKELLEMPAGGSVPDVIVGEYFNYVHRLNGADGTIRWSHFLGNLAGVIQMDLIDDVSGDGSPDILVATFSGYFLCLDGQSGNVVWTYAMGLQYGCKSIPDLNNDGYDDAVTGDQDGIIYCVSGAGDSIFFQWDFGGDDRVNSVNIIPSIDGNPSWEILGGSRQGKVAIFSGGLDAVPVELTAFNAALNGFAVTLTWQTATEINNSGFAIERNYGSGWQQIGFVQGMGTSVQPSKYIYTDNLDKLSAAGTIQYRLKQIDFDGTSEYSDMVEVELVPKKYSLEQNYPNPFNPVTTIRFSLPVSGFTSLKIYDVVGNEITELAGEKMEAGSYEFEFDASGLASGVYFYRLQSAAFTAIKKMVVLK